MSTVTSYINHHHSGIIDAPSTMTDDDQLEVRCGMCARELYVDAEGYGLYCEALNSGLENPFRCEVCSEDYDDFPYQG